MRTLTSIAAKYPAAYFATCCAVGLIIRWFWSGQSFSRFFNPFFPFI